MSVGRWETQSLCGSPSPRGDFPSFPNPTTSLGARASLASAQLQRVVVVVALSLSLSLPSRALSASQSPQPYSDAQLPYSDAGWEGQGRLLQHLPLSPPENSFRGCEKKSDVGASSWESGRHLRHEVADTRVVDVDVNKRQQANSSDKSQRRGWDGDRRGANVNHVVAIQNPAASAHILRRGGGNAICVNDDGPRAHVQHARRGSRHAGVWLLGWWRRHRRHRRRARIPRGRCREWNLSLGDGQLRRRANTRVW